MKKKEYFKIAIPPWPEYLVGKYCYFSSNEKHITRSFNEYVLIFMLKNTLYFTEDDKDIALSPGDWYIQLPWLKQEGKVPSPFAEYFFIHFKCDNYERIESNYTPNCSLTDIKMHNSITLPVRGCFDMDKFIPLFDQLESLQINHNNAIIEQSIFLKLFEKLILTIIEPRSKKQSLASDIQEFLAINYNKHISISDLSNIFSYSSDYITRIFKSEFGMTPSAYIKKKRIEQSMELLSHTEKSISEISELSGYNDETVFFRAFKQLNGVSPSAWRDMNKLI